MNKIKKSIALIIVSLLTTMSTMCSFAIPTFAESQDIGSTLNVTNDKVNKAFIILPENLNLEYSNGTFNKSGKIGVYGNIASGYQVNVLVDKKIKYAKNDSDVKIDGYTMFGSDYDETRHLASWSQTDCAKGYPDSTYNEGTTVFKPISVTVLNKDLSEDGEYSTNVTITYNTDVVGLYSDVCNPNFNQSWVSCTGNDYSDTNGLVFDAYELVKNTTPATINMANVQTAWNTNYANIPAYLNYFKVIYGFADRYNTRGTNTSVETIQMVNGYPYCVRLPESGGIINDSGRFECWLYYKDNSEFTKFQNLNTLIIPSNMEAKYLHDSTYAPNYSNATYNDEFVGNALLFLKDITSDKKFVYVPNIVYQGSMDSWKALSGTTDWVFGNQANIVTVYCQDGTLIYQ